MMTEIVDYDECPRCNGTGLIEAGFWSCPDCKGLGVVAIKEDEIWPEHGGPQDWPGDENVP